ncbi:MAG: beta-lactamase family protein, partial [Bacteroidales bacterium]|nr:beta-lactamase family protein [Bacteroidales bacterium]
LLFAKGYGMSTDTTDMTPGTIMRIASVSKLITATAIVKLMEQGALGLDSKVFGPEGILNDESFTETITDKRYFDLTVENLLRHQSGFTNRFGDPMFRTNDIMLMNQLDSLPDHNTLVKCVIKRKLAFDPGSIYLYSNFGYLLLSMIVERLTGEDYETWTRENVLKPAGCTDMYLAGNLLEDRRPNESCYFMMPNAELEPSLFSADSVSSCYGANDIHSLAGAGAWLASAPELALFISSIDGIPGREDIISDESFRMMTTPDELSKHPLGWAKVLKDGTLVRSGTFDGSIALAKLYPDGECWVFISNTDAWMGPKESSSISALLDSLKGKYSDKLPAQDLFLFQAADSLNN